MGVRFARVAGRGIIAQVGQLMWLKMRHARTELAWWGYALGTDIVDDRDWFERMYQVYALIIVAISLFAGWAAVVDAVEGVAAGLGSVAVVPLVTCASSLPVLTLALAIVRALQQPSFRLTAPDARFVAAGAFDPRAIALVDSLSLAALAAVLGGALAFLGLDAAAVAAHSHTASLMADGGAGAVREFGLAGILLYTGAIACGVAAAAVFGSALGRLKARPRIAYAPFAQKAVFALAVLVIAGGCCAVGFWAIGVFGGDVARQLAFSSMPGEEGYHGALQLGAILLAVASALLVIAACVSMRCARRADLSAAIEQSGAFAAMFDVRRMALIAPDTYRELRRKYRIANRRLRPTIPIGTGRMAVLSRAVLSHIRQFEGLLSLLYVGAILCPMSALMLTSHAPALLLISWGYLVFSSIRALRELSLAFREDGRVRLVRDSLPFSTMEIMLLDGLPACVLTAGCALAVMFGLHTVAPLLVGARAMLLAPLFSLTFCLLAALDGAEFPRSRKQPTSGMAVLATAISAALLSLWEPWAVPCLLVAVDVLVLLKFRHAA